MQRDVLQVRKICPGKLVPDYSQASLLIGRVYQMTAKAASGYKLQSWVVATNWRGGVSKLVPSLRFKMASNLTLTATFADAAPPQVSVANLKPFIPVRLPVASNGTFTVVGAAQDSVGVSNVWYRLNGGSWLNAVGTENWSAALTLAQPVNVFQVYAEDTAGNRSRTTSLRFTYIACDYLDLSTNGSGQVRALVPSKLLDLGRTYTLQAIPDPGQLFSGWSGDIYSTAAKISFVMRSNLTLRASFIPDPFLALKGQYNGLFSQADPMGNVSASTGVTNSGFFTLLLTANGHFSGKLLLEGKHLPFSGSLDLTLQGHASVSYPHGLPLTLDFQVDPDYGTITGTVASNPEWSSTLLARPAATGRANPFAGKYTLVVEGCDVDGACFSFARVPYGDSPAVVRVTGDGALLMAGTLADGVPIIQRTAVSQDGSWPLYAAADRGKTILLGWVNFPYYQAGAYVVWAKAPSLPRDRYYTNEFISPRAAWMYPYTVPSPGQSLVGWTNGTVMLTSGDLPETLISNISLVKNRFQVLGGNISNLVLTVTPNSGWFQGSFVHPLTGRRTVFRGAVLQDFPEYSGGGWFLGPSGASGNVRLNGPAE